MQKTRLDYRNLALQRTVITDELAMFVGGALKEELYYYFNAMGLGGGRTRAHVHLIAGIQGLVDDDGDISGNIFIDGNHPPSLHDLGETLFPSGRQ